MLSDGLSAAILSSIFPAHPTELPSSPFLFPTAGLEELPRLLKDPYQQPEIHACSMTYLHIHG